MTSEEIIEREIAKLATSIQLALGCTPAININIELCQQKLYDLKQLKQDLEMLRFFENYARVFSNISFDEYLKTYCSEETKSKVKEWLDE